jgi:exosortase
MVGGAARSVPENRPLSGALQPTGTKCARKEPIPVTTTMIGPSPKPVAARPRGELLLAAIVAGAVLWAYWPTLHGLARRWSEDPQYSHGYIVPAIALLLLWHRRECYPASGGYICWWGLAPLIGGAGLRLAAAWLHVDWIDAVSLLFTLAGLCLLGGGPPLLRWAWPAVVILCFMLPLPYQAEVALAQPLQRIATLASTYALQTVGFPAVAEGNIILIDDLRIGVLEACSGLGMLMTFFALSTAVALMVRRPLGERLILTASAIPIGVFVNVIRITVTGILHMTAGSAIAHAVFHDLAGWLMMPLALGLLWLEMLYLSRLFPGYAPAPVVPRATASQDRAAWKQAPPPSRQIPIPTSTPGR